MRIRSPKKPEKADVYNACGRAVFFREIHHIARAVHQLAVLAQAPAVTQEAYQHGDGEYYNEK